MAFHSYLSTDAGSHSLANSMLIRLQPRCCSHSILHFFVILCRFRQLFCALEALVGSSKLGVFDRGTSKTINKIATSLKLPRPDCETLYGQN